MTSEIEDERDALETELDSALRKIVALLIGGKNPNEAAWWLCANHARFILNYSNAPLLSGDKAKRLRDMATKAGTPPTGGSWNEWFKRVAENTETE